MTHQGWSDGYTLMHSTGTLPTSQSTIALVHLCLLDLVLDALLLNPPLLGIAPPNRTFVFAFDTEVDTGAT